MNLDSFTGEGSTPSRRRFWDKVTQAVLASQKIAGRFVTVDEHQGQGTIINVADSSTRRGGGGGGGTGACCHPDGSCSSTTAAGCVGTYQGDGTTCGGVDCTPGHCDPVPCPPPPFTGACCSADGTTCADGLTEGECSDSGGIFQTVGTVCADVKCCDSFTPTSITFSGTTIDCCITGSGFSFYYFGTLSGTFTLTPSGSNYIYGGISAVATGSLFFTDDCSGDPDSTGDDLPWGIVVGCSDGTDGFPVGWHIFASGAYGYFAAYGIVNPLSPASNEAPCNGVDSQGNPCVGAGGTAFLS